MEFSLEQACNYILEDKQKYIDELNEEDPLFPVNIFSHFICGITNSEMLDEVVIRDFEQLDFDKPISMDFYAFGQGYFRLEENHFTEDYKSVRKNNSFNKNNLMYIIYNIRSICEKNVLYSLAEEHEKYRHYDMDFDEIFDTKVVDEYLSKAKINNIQFNRTILPVIKNFTLSVDNTYNSIKCEIVLLE